MKVPPLIRHLKSVRPAFDYTQRFDGRIVHLAINYPDFAQMLLAEGEILVLDSSFIPRHEIDECVWETIFKKKVLIPGGVY